MCNTRKEEKETSAATADLLENNLMSKANQLDSDDFKIALKRHKGEYEARFDGENMVAVFNINGVEKQIPAEELQNYNILPKASDAIKNNNDVDNVVNKIGVVYKDVKKNEDPLKTDYLFNGVERSNLDKTVERLEKMNSIMIPRM